MNTGQGSSPFFGQLSNPGASIFGQPSSPAPNPFGALQATSLPGGQVQGSFLQGQSIFGSQPQFSNGFGLGSGPLGQPGFGGQVAATPGSIFGQAAQSTPTPFGQTTWGQTPGQAAAPAFGQSSFGQPQPSGLFGQQPSQQVQDPEFRVTRGKDTFEKGQFLNFQSVSAMPGLEEDSFEEIRARYYQLRQSRGQSSPGISTPGAVQFGGLPAATPQTSAFGASQPSPFGSTQSTPAFGAPSPFGAVATSPAPQSSIFGATQGVGAFGATQSSIFGASASTGAFGSTQGPLFGVGQSAPAFGAAAPSPFGASQSAPAFGTPQTSPFGSTLAAPAFGASQPSIFGSSSSTPSFGAPQQSPFGASQSAGAFGAPQTSIFAGSQPAAASQTSIFGTSSFGTPQTSLFGATQSTSAFGTPQSTPAFGTPQSTPAFGTPQSASVFGTPQSTSAFGTPQSTSAFGTPQSTSAFGTPQSMSAFGTPQSTSAFGTPQSTPAFGAPQSTSVFGTTQSTTPFGTPQATPFGAPQSTPAFGVGSQASLFGGSSTAPAFGTPQTSIFGGSQTTPALGTWTGVGTAPQTSVFGGSQSSPAFGATQPSLFGGTQSSPAFGGTQASIFGTGQAAAAAAGTQTSIFAGSQAAAAGQQSNTGLGFSLFGSSHVGTTQPSIFGTAAFGSPQLAGGTSGTQSSLFAPSQTPGAGLGATQSLFASATPTQPPFGNTATDQFLQNLPFQVPAWMRAPAQGGAQVAQVGATTAGQGFIPPPLALGMASQAAVPDRQPYNIRWLDSVIERVPAGGSRLAHPFPGLAVREQERRPLHGWRQVMPSVNHESEGERRFAEQVQRVAAGGTHRNLRLSDLFLGVPPVTGATSAQSRDRRAQIQALPPLVFQSHLPTARDVASAFALPNGDAGRQAAGSPAPEVEVASGEQEAADVAVPRLAGEGYYTLPELYQMKLAERRSPGYCREVEGFTVGRLGCAQIKWHGTVDVSGLDLNKIICIQKAMVAVYDDDHVQKPSVGTGLNKPAEITFWGIHCRDASGNIVTEGPAAEAFERILRENAGKQGGQHKSYDHGKAEWIIEVTHFSRYEYMEPDDGDTVPVEAADFDELMEECEKGLEAIEGQLQAAEPAVSYAFSLPDETVSVVQLLAADKTDIRRFLGQSFRVGWGPGGRFVHAGQLSSRVYVKTATVGVSVIGSEKTQKEYLGSLMREHISHRFEDGDDGPSWRAVLPDLRHVCGRYDRLLLLQAPGSSLKNRQHMIWTLLPVLFPSSDKSPAPQASRLALEDSDPEASSPLPPAMRSVSSQQFEERRELDQWLRKYMDQMWLSADVKAAGSSYLDRIFKLVSFHRVEEAVQVAMQHGDTRLACLLSQAGTFLTERSLLQCQIQQWREEAMIGEGIETERAALLLLLAGKISEAFELSNRSTNWMCYLGLLLWYTFPAEASLAFVIGKLCLFVDQNHSPASAPLTQQYSLEYHLMALYNRLHSGTPPDQLAVEKLLHYAIDGESMDVSFAWLLLTTLQASAAVPAYPMLPFHLSFISQLITAGFPHYAVYVALQIPSISTVYRTHLISQLLASTCHLWNDDSTTIHFMERVLQVPSSAIHAARALYYGYLGDREQQLLHLEGSEDWDAAHDVFMQEMAGQYFMEGKTSQLSSKLSLYARHSSGIAQWNIAGQTVLEYLHLHENAALLLLLPMSADSLRKHIEAVEGILRRVSLAINNYSSLTPVLRQAFVRMADSVCLSLVDYIEGVKKVVTVMERGEVFDLILDANDTMLKAPVSHSCKSKLLQCAVSHFSHMTPHLLKR